MNKYLRRITYGMLFIAVFLSNTESVSAASQILEETTGCIAWKNIQPLYNSTDGEIKFNSSYDYTWIQFWIDERITEDLLPEEYRTSQFLSDLEEAGFEKIKYHDDYLTSQIWIKKEDWKDPCKTVPAQSEDQNQFAKNYSTDPSGKYPQQSIDQAMSPLTFVLLAGILFLILYLLVVGITRRKN